MEKLSPGLYEQIINSRLEDEISKLDFYNDHVQKDHLKNFDSVVLLSQYLHSVLKKSLY
jgi:hypothetical protein